MTPIEAYNITMNEIKSLSEDDFIITFKTSIAIDNTKLIEMYRNVNGTIPHNLWKSVNIKSKNGDYTKIWELQEKIYEFGVSFDTGFGDGRDFELDWSFRYDKKNDKRLIKFIGINELKKIK